MRERIGVIGGGSWGTALAKLLAEKGYPVSLWIHNPERCREIADKRENSAYLPGISLPYNLTPSADLREIASGKTALVCVVPSHVLRPVMSEVSPFVDGKLVISATKGIEDETSKTMLGVELGGAVKNVIAVAAGVSDGLGFGHNSRAALITRGIAEIARLGARMGADPRTLAGLAGMGDLFLTCTGDLSRNRSVGLRLG
jgi:glycerol-3-phosphate dehydrogenase (NAD(P)+)